MGSFLCSCLLLLEKMLICFNFRTKEEDIFEKYKQLYELYHGTDRTYGFAPGPSNTPTGHTPPQASGPPPAPPGTVPNPLPGKYDSRYPERGGRGLSPRRHRYVVYLRGTMRKTKGTFLNPNVLLHSFTFQSVLLAPTASASSGVKPDIIQSKVTFYNDIRFVTVYHRICC